MEESVFTKRFISVSDNIHTGTDVLCQPLAVNDKGRFN